MDNVLKVETLSMLNALQNHKIGEIIYVEETEKYMIYSEEGWVDLTMNKEAVDNAGNIHISEAENFSVDKNDPEILGFLLLSGDEREDITPISIKSDIYGYYFQSETIVKVKGQLYLKEKISIYVV